MDFLIERINAWEDYELLDSGAKQKLERFGKYTVVRPDPRALWQKNLPEKTWPEADAFFDGDWHFNTRVPNEWTIDYKDLKFVLKPTAFKHLGVFPEQSVNWDWLKNVNVGKQLKVLNLFAYTGGNTLACAKAGGKVTHVDSSKPSVIWAKENAKLSNLSETSVRWIVDDVFKFVLREGRRGEKYDGLIMDPPKFGRGGKGEVWKIEEDLPKLLQECKNLFSLSFSFLLVNLYSTDLSPIALGQLVSDYVKMLGGILEYGELAIKESQSQRLLPSGIFARWKR